MFFYCNLEIENLIFVASDSLMDKSFKSLEGQVSEETLNAVEQMNFVNMTDIQARSIPYMLIGRYVLILIISCVLCCTV